MDLSYETVEHPIQIEMHYDYTEWGNATNNHLMVASKGGSGHITAMMALLELYPPNKWAKHNPRLYAEEPNSTDKFGIFFVSKFGFIRKRLREIGGIAIPSYRVLKPAIEKMNESTPRPFVDTLRDVSPIGYEAAAIWDEMQRCDMHDMLSKLISFQPENDRRYHAIFYNYFLSKLVEAYYAGTPYSKIISTQVIGLPAICDAVIAYNTMVDNHWGNTVSRVNIEQFMTDLPTVGAVHFFNPLGSLTQEQQQQMNLHAVDLTVDVLMECLGCHIHFAHLYRIDPKNNPMVRAGFKEIDNSTRFAEDIALILKNGDLSEIKAEEKIASIMLSGQGGYDSVRYIVPLLEAGMDKVFVFGGCHSPIKEKIDQLLCYEKYAGKIIPLPNQDASFIAGLGSRCLVEVIRGGGLTVMEKLALNHHPSKHIFIHYSDASLGAYKSGIAWEDSNADKLIDSLGKQGIHVQKTCPMDFNEHLRQALGLEAHNEDDGLFI